MRIADGFPKPAANGFPVMTDALSRKAGGLRNEGSGAQGTDAPYLLLARLSLILIAHWNKSLKVFWGRGSGVEGGIQDVILQAHWNEVVHDLAGSGAEIATAARCESIGYLRSRQASMPPSKGRT
jgi:hypothetical protein